MIKEEAMKEPQRSIPARHDVPIVSTALHGSQTFRDLVLVLSLHAVTVPRSNQVSLEGMGCGSPGDANHEGILTAGATNSVKLAPEVVRGPWRNPNPREAEAINISLP
jgi:hypothetical protein